MSLPEFCEFLMQTPCIVSQSSGDFGHIGTLGSFVLTQILRPPKGTNVGTKIDKIDEVKRGLVRA